MTQIFVRSLAFRQWDAYMCIRFRLSKPFLIAWNTSFAVFNLFFDMVMILSRLQWSQIHFLFLEKYTKHFSNKIRHFRHKMSVFNDSLIHGHFWVFLGGTSCIIFDIPSLACRIVHDYHSSCSEIFRHIWNWRVYPLRSGAWKLSSSDWLIRLSLILPLQNFIKN